MSTTAPLLDELLAEFAAPTPAKSAKAAHREHPRGPRADSEPCEGLRTLANPTGAQTQTDSDSQTFAGIRKLQDAPTSKERRALSQDSQDSQGCLSTCVPAARVGGNPLLTNEQAERCHAPAWNDAEIDAFAARRDRLLRWGRSEQQAEDLAERLTLRDREADQRVSCTDCQYYRPGRCGNHKVAGLGSADVSHDLAAMLQRCPGFQFGEMMR